MVKHLHAVKETQVRSQGWEDPLEKEIANHSGSSKPFLENPMDRGVWQATVHGVARVRHNLVTKPPPQFSGMFKDGVWRPSTFSYTFYAVPESVATSHDGINLCLEICLRY